MPNQGATVIELYPSNNCLGTKRVGVAGWNDIHPNTVYVSYTVQDVYQNICSQDLCASVVETAYISARVVLVIYNAVNVRYISTLYSDTSLRSSITVSASSNIYSVNKHPLPIYDILTLLQIDL